jgi:cell division protein FtsB
MNAQEKWKMQYQAFKKNMYLGRVGEAYDHLDYAKRYRREAALERRIAALERENEALKTGIDTLQRAIRGGTMFVGAKERNALDAGDRLLHKWPYNA